MRVHAAQMPREIEPVAAIEMERQLAIRAGGERCAGQLGVQLEVVVDLAIGDERGAAGLVERLVAGREIDDREPRLHHADIARAVMAVAVGPAMAQRRLHRLQQRGRRRLAARASSCRRCRTSAPHRRQEVAIRARPRAPRLNSASQAARPASASARAERAVAGERASSRAASASASSIGTRSPVSPSLDQLARPFARGGDHRHARRPGLDDDIAERLVPRRTDQHVRRRQQRRRRPRASRESARDRRCRARRRCLERVSARPPRPRAKMEPRRARHRLEQHVETLVADEAGRAPAPAARPRACRGLSARHRRRRGRRGEIRQVVHAVLGPAARARCSRRCRAYWRSR